MDFGALKPWLDGATIVASAVAAALWWWASRTRLPTAGIGRELLFDETGEVMMSIGRAVLVGARRNKIAAAVSGLAALLAALALAAGLVPPA